MDADDGEEPASEPFAQLAVTLVHELNNPLFAISMSADLVRAVLDPVDLPAEVRANIDEQTDVIAAQVQRIAAMAQAVQGLVQPVRDLHLRDLALAGWLAELAATLAVEFDRPVVAEGEDLTVHTDHDQLELALRALVRNAAQADPGGAPIVLRAGRAPHDDAVATIDVTDRGPGVPDRIRDRLFEPFTSTSGSTGAGLGLPLARHAIAQLGGTLDLRDTGVDGTTVRVSLPLAAGRPGGGPAVQATASRPWRAVLLDDAEGVRQSVAALLRRDGFEVEAVADASSVERWVADGPIDVFIADLHFSRDVTLGQLLTRLEARQPDVRARTVVITGDPSAVVAPLGVAEVLRKPFGLMELESAIAAVLDRR